VPKISRMGLGTLNTILNTAPLIIQGASKLIKLIKDRDESEKDGDVPSTLEGLKDEISRIHSRLDDNNKSDVEQIKLIEQLAKQNETLAESLRNTIKRQNVVFIIVVIAFILSFITFVFAINQ